MFPLSRTPVSMPLPTPCRPAARVGVLSLPRVVMTFIMRPLVLCFARPLVALALLAGLAACGSDSLKPPPPAEPGELYWALELDHHAVTLSTAATHNTLQLVATPRNYQGAALAELPAPRYVSRDPATVAVSTDGGLLTAVAPTSAPVWVVATLTAENLKHEDSVIVQVVSTDPPPVLASLSIHPPPTDSAKASAEGTTGSTLTFGLLIRKVLTPQMTDDGGAPLDGYPVAFRSSDTTIAQFTAAPASGSSTAADPQQAPYVWGLRPGAVTFYASATVFGVTKADTLPYQIGWPVVRGVEIYGPSRGAAPGTIVDPGVTVGVGGVVFWSLLPSLADTTITTEFTFAEAQLPQVAPLSAAGNFLNPLFVSIFLCSGFSIRADCVNGGHVVLGPSPGYVAAMRVFTAAGTYEYQTSHGTRGRIVVVAE